MLVFVFHCFVFFPIVYLSDVFAHVYTAIAEPLMKMGLLGAICSGFGTCKMPDAGLGAQGNLLIRL